MRITLALRVLTLGLGAVCATQAGAEYRYDTGDGGALTVYGQLDPAYLSFDDGVSTTGEIVDNTNSNSRIGLWYRRPTQTGEFSVNLETAFGFRPSSALSQTATPEARDWQRTDIRKIEAIWRDDRFGAIFLGQGSTSSDGAANRDLSGTALVLHNSIPDTAGSFSFRTRAGALSTRTIRQSFGSFDGGRRARVRYDTLSFGGVRLSASYGEEVLAQGSDTTVADVGLFYDRTAGRVRLAGALAYARVDPGAGQTRHDAVGSFSVLHDSGVNVTVAAGHRKDAGAYLYGKLGYKADWLSFGATAVAVDYYAGADMTSAGARSASFGVGLVQSFDKAKVDAYLGYRDYRLTEDAARYRDAASVMFGARWTF